jgi:hypothetical protein
MHDHRKLAGHRNGGLAMASALAINRPHAFTFSLRLKCVSNADAAS